ncbi:MAG: ABC transporter permease [Myxococcales bacterium]|nr:ABC transporter permease [Myxococcales bacterium]MCB9673130.1 ABC transporter permease [Alphaproteobacteria bacterium]
MTGPNLVRLAWRNLWRNTRRTLLTLVAISFGLLMAVLFTALQDRSFSDMIDLAARLHGGHVVVQHPEYLDSPTLDRSVQDAPAKLAAIRALPGVQAAVPRITGNVMVASARGSYGALFIAYDPALESPTTLSFLEGVQGDMLDSADGDGVVLGTRLAKNLGVGIGDKVVYTATDSTGEIVSGLARLRATVGTGAPSLDGALVLLPIESVRRVLGYTPGEVTRIAVFIDDSRNSPRVRDAVNATLTDGAVALTWDEVQPELNGFIAMKVGGARFMELVILILVSASIFNTLFVSVMERTREFGIMLAIGWTPRQVSGLIVLESVWLAISGIVLGAALTTPLYLYLKSHPIDVSAQFAADGAPMEIAGVGIAPVLQVGIFPESVVVIVCAIVLATLLSGLYPAWRAGRTVPVESIRLV